MVAHVFWSGGGEAELVLLQGELIEMRSTVPFAPGSRPSGALATAKDQTVWLKVHRSRRGPDHWFHVRGRLLNVTRELRIHLEAATAAAVAPGLTVATAGPAIIRPAVAPTSAVVSGPAATIDGGFSQPVSLSLGSSDPAPTGHQMNASTAFTRSSRIRGDDKESSS